MKGVVVYKSKYGARRQYAQWIASKLGFALLTPDKINSQVFNEAEVVIVGTSVYIGKMLIKAWMQEYAEILKRKRIFLFVVCGTPASDTPKTRVIVEKNLPVELIDKCHVFFLPGSLVLENLSFLDKMALRMGARFEKDPEQKKRMLYGYNDIKQENISPLLYAVSEVMEPALPH